MKPADRDKALLGDMLKSCLEILDFMQDIDLEHFVADRKLCLAVERSLEIIGEAAGRVSQGFQRQCPQIPWRKIKGLRNILAHEYGHIEYPALFNTTRFDVPSLLSELLHELHKNDDPQ